MNTKSLFLNSPIDFQMSLHHPNNFEDSLSRDDIQGFFYPTKVSAWHAFSLEPPQKQAASASASPSGTPQGSPYNARKHFDATGQQSDMKKRWFNSNLFATFADPTLANGTSGGVAASDRATSGSIRKSNSYKNVSNFDINAVGPISF